MTVTQHLLNRFTAATIVKVHWAKHYGLFLFFRQWRCQLNDE